MPKPTENKTVQNRILTYTQEIGWKFISREEAEARRGFNNYSGNIQGKAQQASLYFDDLLYQEVRQFKVNQLLSDTNLLRRQIISDCTRRIVQYTCSKKRIQARSLPSLATGW